MAVQVKICGLSRPEDVEAVNAARADYAGFVFHPASKRYIDFKTAAGLLRLLDGGIRSVAVCVSPDEALLDKLSSLSFDFIQIHGSLDPALLDALSVPVWQAVNLTESDALPALLTHPAIDGYVVDGAAWGSGETFGWDKDGASAVDAKSLRERMSGRRFILAGGLSCENVKEGIRLFSPDVVDVSSGVENEGGKDPEEIFRFVREVREI